MRKIVAGLYITLDGVVESPEKWHFPYYDPDMARSVETLMGRCDAMLLGRRTYEEFAAHWPRQDPADPLAALMNERTKYVVSATLTDPAWQNTTAVTLQELAALREGPGGDLGISGSPTLVASLLREGLLDELHPLVADRCRPRPAGRPSDLASAMPVWLLRWQAQAVGWDS